MKCMEACAGKKDSEMHGGMRSKMPRGMHRASTERSIDACTEKVDSEMQRGMHGEVESEMHRGMRRESRQ